MDRCIECRGELAVGTTVVTLECGERTVSSTVEALVCARCGDDAALIDCDALLKAEVDFAKALAASEIDLIVFRYMRKALGLTGDELAPLLGTTAQLVAAWEKGERDLPENAWRALEAIVQERAASI